MFHGYARYHNLLHFIQRNRGIPNKYPLIREVFDSQIRMEFSAEENKENTNQFFVLDLETKCQVVIEFVCEFQWNSQIVLQRLFSFTLYLFNVLFHSIQTNNVLVIRQMHRFYSLLCGIWNSHNTIELG